MNKYSNVKEHKSFGEIIFRFLFGFLIPFLAINGLILFLFIQTPKIIVLEADAKDYEENKIKFTVECMLPVIDLKTYFQEQEVPYSKFGAYYIIDATENGTYQVSATSLNKATVNSYINVETRDGEPPKINTADAVISGNVLSVTVTDDQSGINYDNVYGINEDQSTSEPTYVDRASGTIQFDFENKKKLTIHIEDNYGNSTEATFNAG